MGCPKEPRLEEGPPLRLRGPRKKLGKERGYLFPFTPDGVFQEAGSREPGTQCATSQSRVQIGSCCVGEAPNPGLKTTSSE